jgi:hypothetical protein
VTRVVVHRPVVHHVHRPVVVHKPVVRHVEHRRHVEQRKPVVDRKPPVVRGPVVRHNGPPSPAAQIQKQYTRERQAERRQHSRGRGRD